MRPLTVAVRGGAGDTGLTIANAVESLRDETLRLSPHRLPRRSAAATTPPSASTTPPTSTSPPIRCATATAGTSTPSIPTTTGSPRAGCLMAPGPPSPVSYLREHITHGYAITVHAAQGVTTATTHAVLGETTTRNLLYVAMTRGRESNQAYLYERRAGETEHEYAEAPGVHAMRRGNSHDASQLVRHQSPPATSGPAPPTTSPPTPKTMTSCRTGWPACCTATPALYRFAGLPTPKSRTPPSISCWNAGAGSTNTSAATTAVSRAWTTASTSDRI